MRHAGADLENFQMLQVKLRKLRETGGNAGQIGLQRVQVGMGYEENIK